VGHVPTFLFTLFGFVGSSFGMDATDRLISIITPTIEDMGFEVVRVQVSGAQRPILQVMADRADGNPISVDDCADISRAISALLDVEDPIKSAYTLEVSSPGIDRPLTRLKDFERFAGNEARVEMRLPVDGRKRFRGMLRGVEDGKVLLDMPEGPAALPFADLQRAKLVLTDALIEAAKRRYAEHAPDSVGDADGDEEDENAAG
jgi:ribosome maturation factor RimP